MQCHAVVLETTGTQHRHASNPDTLEEINEAEDEPKAWQNVRRT